MRAFDAAAGLGRILFERQGAPRRKPSAALADLLQLSPALHRNMDRLVHGRGGASALDDLRTLEDRRRDDAVPDGPRGNDLAPRLLRRLQLHLRVRHILHISAPAGWSRRLSGSAANRRGPKPAHVGCRCTPDARPRSPRRRRVAMVMFWVAILAISILLYVLLDGFDLGVGMLFGLTRGEEGRRAMLSAVAPIWDGNETWLVVTAVILWGAFPVVYATLLSAFYLPLLVMLAGLILRGVAFEFRYKAERARWIWDWSFAGGSPIATFIQGITVSRRS